MSDRLRSVPPLPAGRLGPTLSPLPVDQQDGRFELFLLLRIGRDALPYSFNLVIVEVSPSGGWLTVWGDSLVCA